MALLTSILIWSGIVVVGLIALVVLTFVVYMVWTACTGGFAPKAVELEVTWPPLLGVDQAFNLGVTVRNLADVERVIHSIDIDSSLLKGFVVRQIEPKTREDSSGMGTTAYYFDGLHIPPRGHTHVAFSCHTVVAGDFRGNVQAYVDYKNLKSVDREVRMVIR